MFVWHNGKAREGGKSQLCGKIFSANVFVTAAIVIFALPSAALACQVPRHLETPLTAAFFGLFVALAIWGIFSILMKDPSFTKVYICTFLSLVLFMKLLEPPGSSDPEPSFIINNLRSLKSACVKLNTESRDVVNAEGFTLTMPMLERYLKDEPWINESRGYLVFSDPNGVWWVGFNSAWRPADVRRRLVPRARAVGIFGTSGPTPPASADEVYHYKEQDAYVWMLARKAPEVDG